MPLNALYVSRVNGFESRSDAGSVLDDEEIPMEMDLTADGPPISEDETIDKQMDWRAVFIMYAKMILPHVGLVLLLFVYLIIGATIFNYVEGPNEILTRKRELETIFGLRDNFHDIVWNITVATESYISRETFDGIGRQYFDALVKAMYQAYHNQFITESHLLNESNDGQMLWTYANSIFFATTVITTIGYGNLVPVTKVGRIACICFALFGIPLLLVTIADIGKFLSDFLSFLYRTYRAFKRKVQKQSRRLSHHYRDRSYSQSISTSTKAGSLNLHDIDSESKSSCEDELRIPVVMVLFVLVAYTAIGGLLFQMWEGWPYFDAFYFCFITMATVGFGDIVPTEQVYMFFTMAYIIFGLALATMCIDLAGTEYIRKIHYLGTKMEDAKGAVMTGLHAGEHLLKHRGIEVIRTASGKLIQVRGAVLSSRQARELGVDYILADLDYQQKNILYEPLSQAVQRAIKGNNIKILPDDITEKDGYIVKNKSYDKSGKRQYRTFRRKPDCIHRLIVPSDGKVTVVIPFMLKESDV